MKGHNRGRCRKCGKVHKSTLGIHFKLTGQALKNHNEAARKPERNRKRHKTMKKRYGYFGAATGKHWILISQALKNRQETNRKRIGQSYEEICDSKERADEWNRKRLETRRSNLPYIHKNIHFDSQNEIECYKFVEPLNVPFIYQFYVGKNPFDFLFFDKKTKKPKLFWEPHPSNRWWIATPENVKKYTKERRKILDENEYKDVPLIVTTDLSEETKNNVVELLS